MRVCEAKLDEIPSFVSYLLSHTAPLRAKYSSGSGH